LWNTNFRKDPDLIVGILAFLIERGILLKNKLFIKAFVKPYLKEIIKLATSVPPGVPQKTMIKPQQMGVDY